MAGGGGGGATTMKGDGVLPSGIAGADSSSCRGTMVAEEGGGGDERLRGVACEHGADRRK